MESKLDQCVLQDDLMNLQRMVEDKTREFHGAMTLLNDQVKTMDEEMDESKRYVIIFRGIFIVTQIKRQIIIIFWMGKSSVNFNTLKMIIYKDCP